MKVVSLEQVLSWKPCEAYPRSRIEELFADKESISVEDVCNAELDSIMDKIWMCLHQEFLTENQPYEIAIFASELALQDFETEYPDDDRPRRAIQEKKDWIDGKILVTEIESEEGTEWISEQPEAKLTMVLLLAGFAWSISRPAAWSTYFPTTESTKLLQILNFIKSIAE